MAEPGYHPYYALCECEQCRRTAGERATGAIRKAAYLEAAELVRRCNQTGVVVNIASFREYVAQKLEEMAAEEITE